MDETSLIISAFGLLCVAVGVVMGYWLAGGFQKPPRRDQTHATLLAQPGSTLDLVRHHGEREIVVAKVVLSNITRDRDGTSVLFEDYYNWVRKNYRG